MGVLGRAARRAAAADAGGGLLEGQVLVVRVRLVAAAGGAVWRTRCDRARNAARQEGGGSLGGMAAVVADLHGFASEACSGIDLCVPVAVRQIKS